MFPTQEHVDAAQRAADRLKAETGAYIWPSVSLAQAQIESAGWTVLSGMNNGFGIKATSAQITAGQCRLVWTHETINGAYIKVQQHFANFSSLEDAYYAHAKLLATSAYYDKARHTSDPRAFANALTGIYATGIPGHPYGQALIAIMDAGNLHRFDQPGSAQPQTEPRSAVPPSGANAYEWAAWVQGWLNAHGAAPALLVDGDFGEKSRDALSAYLAKSG